MRRLAVLCLKNGSPQPDTIVLLDGIAGDDEADAELRRTAGGRRPGAEAHASRRGSRSYAFFRACGCAWKYSSRRRLSETCVYSSVVARSAWPSISCTERRSAPPSSRCVANECRSRCGWTRSGSSPAAPARRRRMRKAPARVSGAALGVEEQLRPVAAVEERPAAGEVAAQRLGRLAADRDDALLRALADAADEPPLEVDGGALEADRLADAQAGAVEQLDEGAVAERARRRAGGGLDQPLGLAGRERPRQRPRRRGSSSSAAGLSVRAPSSTWWR